ncbi:MAG: zinc ribbon domain-containing protein, partial [Anaerolineales bacterium]|nr:zinc ribbon domain-containing protein [Anaerolineales bacterium]
MDCARCGFSNPEGFGFCGRCGAPLTRACPSCGQASPPGLV